MNSLAGSRQAAPWRGSGWRRWVPTPSARGDAGVGARGALVGQAAAGQVLQRQRGPGSSGRSARSRAPVVASSAITDWCGVQRKSRSPIFSGVTSKVVSTGSPGWPRMSPVW